MQIWAKREAAEAAEVANDKQPRSRSNSANESTATLSTMVDFSTGRFVDVSIGESHPAELWVFYIIPSISFLSLSIIIPSQLFQIAHFASAPSIVVGSIH